MSETINFLMGMCSVAMIIMCVAVVIVTIRLLITANTEDISPFEKYSLKRKGVTLNIVIKFNSEDERDYVEIVDGVEEMIIEGLNTQGHTLLSKWSKSLTEMDLKQRQ